MGSSQEGRIVLMTSNFADKLDEALVRSGRTDKQVYTGPITKKVAEQIFTAHFGPDEKEFEKAQSETGRSEKRELDVDMVQHGTSTVPILNLGELAPNSSSQIPEDTFTPAEIQGYLLLHRGFPAQASKGVGQWIDEDYTAEAAKVRAENLKGKLKGKLKRAEEEESNADAFPKMQILRSKGFQSPEMILSSLPTLLPPNSPDATALTDPIEIATSMLPVNLAWILERAFEEGVN